MGKQRKPLLMLLKLVKLLKPLLLLLRKLVLKLNKMLPKLKLLARVLNKMLPLLLLHVKLQVKLVNLLLLHERLLLLLVSLLLKQERQLVKLDNKLKPLGLLVKELLLLLLLLMKPLEDFLKLKLTCKKSNPNLVNRLGLCGGSIENCTCKRNISLPAEEAFPNKRLDHLSYG